MSNYTYFSLCLSGRKSASFGVYIRLWIEFHPPVCQGWRNSIEEETIMSENKIIDTFWDESPIDVSQEANFIWSIANKLRGSYMPDKYGDVIIPMTIIRRFECALSKKKQIVREAFEKNSKHPPKALCRLSGYQFYNTSGYDLAELCNDADYIADNFKAYIKGFSSNVQDILTELEIYTHIDKMDKDGCLYSVVKAFSELDLSLETFDSIKMGYIFENLIGRFFQNVDAGQFYTGRDIIKLLVEILMSEGCDDIFDNGKVITVCDQACGTGGMLSTAYNYIKHYNPTADVRLFGQEFMGVSYAVGLAEMLIKNQNSENFRHTDTFKEDCFEDIKMRFVIENPPFGTPWSGKDAKVGQEDAVRDEYAKGETGRWGHGLPDAGDSQLIFMQSAIDKMDEKLGRAAIIENSSSLMSSKAAAGESQIRRWMLEMDLIEAIIALPVDLFYNTGIQTYVWILSKNKRAERKGKVQLINAASFYHKLRKAVGDKKNEIAPEDRKRIAHLYADFVENEFSKIYRNEEFLYREYTIMQPLQRSYAITEERIESMLINGNLNTLYDEAKVREFENQGVAISDADKKKLNKFIESKPLFDMIIETLRANISDKVYLSPQPFIEHLKSILSIEKKWIEKIADGLSVMDKSAEIHKDKKGNIIYDKTTAETEVVKIEEDIETYMAREVLPHVPDAKWFFEENLDAKKPVIKTGADIAFTRYFYQYQQPTDSEELEKQFIEIEKSVSERIKKLFG